MASSAIIAYMKRWILDTVMVKWSLFNLPKASMRRVKCRILFSSVKSGQIMTTSKFFKVGNIWRIRLTESTVPSPQSSRDSSRSCGMCRAETQELTPSRFFERRYSSFKTGTFFGDQSFWMENRSTSSTVRIMRSGIVGRVKFSS